MSVKIYAAWRWEKRHGLFEMTKKISDAAMQELRGQLRKIVREAKIEENRQARYELLQFLSQHIRVSAVSLLRDPYDYNYRFMVRRAGNFFLCMPTDNHQKFDFLKKIPHLEEYGYWDNTDQPEGISRKDWKARGRFWDKYWIPEAHCVEFSPICQTNPFPDIQPVLCPDLWKKEQLPKGYWEDKEAK